MSDKFIRKNVVFNKKSRWHMKILQRIEKESDNFSGYVMAILKEHFDIRSEIKDIKSEKEQPVETTQIVIKSPGIKFKE